MSTPELVQLRRRPDSSKTGAEHDHPRPEGDGPHLLPPNVDRRSFLALLAASAALASACTKAAHDKIFPYGAEPPPELTPGNPLHYATRATLQGYASGILVRSDEGRPTKVEGNPDDPSSSGVTGLQELSLILSLYDPRRARGLLYQGQPRAWAELAASIRAPLAAQRARRGAGLRFLVEPDASPLLADLRRRLLAAFPAARFVSWSPLFLDELYRGASIAFGQPLETRLEISAAQVILALDDDLFGRHPDRLRLMREFGAHRTPDSGLNRLYVAETAPSITGLSADHRLRLRSSEIGPFLLHLAGALSATLPSLLVLRREEASLGWQPTEEGRRWLGALSRDLLSHRGTSLVTVGPRQPAAVHALAHAINAALGSLGRTVRFLSPILPDLESGPGALANLAAEMEAGDVEMLAVTAWNPAFTAFPELRLGELLPSVPWSAYLGAYEDETHPACQWFVPRSHPLEEWGDGTGPDGTVLLAQPLLSRLFPGVAEVELLALFLGEETARDHDLLRRLHSRPEPDGFEGAWQARLQRGRLPGSGPTPIPVPPIRTEAVISAARSIRAPNSGLEVGFFADPKLLDGRFAENAWLLELPDPVTKVTWENPAWISPSTAASLGLSDGDELSVRYRGRSIRLPAVIVPGHAEGAISLFLGWGRTRPLSGISREIGTDVYRIRRSEAPWFDSGIEVERVPGASRRLAVTQGHWSMEDRQIAVSTDLPEWQRHASGLIPSPPSDTLYPRQSAAGVQWAMSIDLGKCVGCGVCTLACQAENNIPVVGYEGVLQSREMHWIRVDRYWEGPDPANPRAITQPVPCMHCEDAPCEYVCPVNAAVHDEEGLNEQIYNRCIGTRYCSNNCPYKVRRFNFFEYNDQKDRLEILAMNPDVTVRERGVMEKCTYCIQRIERSRIVARREGRELSGDDVTPACVQACPTRAFHFGDLATATSAVARDRKDRRSYALLGELGTRPRTTYLARVRNTNPELA